MLDIKLPEVGENIESGNVVSIAVAVGDTVAQDQDLLELETDKASLPVPSPTAGVIKEILISEGEDVKIGAVIMKIAPTSADAESESRPSKTSVWKETSGAAASAPKKDTTKKVAAKKDAPKSETKPEPKKTSQAKTAPQASRAKVANESIPPQTDVSAAPSVRRLARELGITISQVTGSGKGGRVSEEDVKTYAKQIISSGSGVVSAGITAKPLPDFSSWGPVRREKMKKIRQVTADHLSYCWQTIPHVTQFGNADITDLEKLRKKYSTKDRKLTVTPFLLKVIASALKNFPQFNASVDMTTHEIVYKEFINIGVAVDTDNGLLVPVIRDVDQKSILQINDEVVSVAEKARDRKVMPDDLRGGSMTLTNLGGIGGTSFTPIVNWPEVAILGVSRGGWEPVYENGHFLPRFKLPLSLSYDHRVIDGADGARFLKWICDAIEQPFMMDLEG